MHLTGARVLITGAGSGLGRRMALEAAGLGAELVVWDLNALAGERVAEEIRTLGGRASAQAVDVTDSGAVSSAAEEAGAVDVLINNAGVVTGKRLLEASEAQIRRTFEVNALALYWTTRAFLPGMLERGRGKVVTIASAAGLIGVAKQTDYSASKWAAMGFAESLRAELRKDRAPVSTLVVAPYYIDTGMFDGVRTKWPLVLPILQERDVARRVVDAIERDRLQLVMPPFLRVQPIGRMLPVVAWDWLADLLGVNDTMDEFTGRQAVEHQERTPQP
ncbi:MAG: SDR family oxidoreductase [Microbacteriaceae bacterium]|nr:SDR family oxidoreductase [Microbacteriaceae bacterium]